MKNPYLRIGFAVLLTFLLFGANPAHSKAKNDRSFHMVLAATKPAGAAIPADTPSKPGNPRLAFALFELASAFKSGGTPALKALADRRQIDLNDSSVRVVVETGDNAVDGLAKNLAALGAKEEARNGDLLQIRVPVSSLLALADFPQVSYIRLPFLSRSAFDMRSNAWSDMRTIVARPSSAIVSEGVQAIGADVWHNAGITGQGIKVAILDLGFSDYESRLGVELPSTVTTQSFRVDGDISGRGEPHGTAVAEIIHDLAPGAQLLLVNYQTDVEWLNAIDFAISQGADIISSSIGSFEGPLDGTGTISTKVAQARNAGVFWAQAAGNHAARHWGGDFVDLDNDSLNDFAPGVNQNSFSVPPRTAIDISLSWNDWPASAQDYDLVLMQQIGGQWREVATSENPQTGTQPPFETIFFPSVSGGTFGVAIRKFSATRPVRFELFNTDLDLQFAVAKGSLVIPGDSPGAVTVGATDFRNGTLESYSSQGPTTDGRTKPDLTAPDGVSTSFGQFSGTSASTPHVAGAAALVKSANGALGPSQIQAFLEQQAVDLGPPGKDSLYGAGRLRLGPPVVGQPGTIPAQPNSVDPKIEIVFPHDALGNPTTVIAGTLANIGAFVFQPGSVNPVPCNFNEPVRLFRALNSNVAEPVKVGVPRLVNRNGNQITLWEFNDVDVSAATDPANKYYFFVAVDGFQSNTNVWSHGADARTIFPVQDSPTGIAPIGTSADAKIEVVFPHDALGSQRAVADADFVNIGIDVFASGTLSSAPPDADLSVRLFRSLNNGTEELVGTGQKQVINRSGPNGNVTVPRWVFNNVDVSQAKNPLNKYYFRVSVDGITTNSSIWAHGADARTIFPTQDVPAASCQ